MAAIDVLLREIDRELDRSTAPPVATPEVYRSGEQLSDAQRESVCLHMIELAALERLYELTLTSGNTPAGMGAYVRNIRPLIDTIQDPKQGIGAAQNRIRENWRTRNDGGVGRGYAMRVNGTLVEADPEEATQAYIHLQLTEQGRLTPAAEIALWMLYGSDHNESLAFCSDQGLAPYLYEAPLLVDYLADHPVTNGIGGGEDALYHISHARDDISRYMHEYAQDHPS